MDAETPPRVAYCFDRFTLDLDRGALLDEAQDLLRTVPRRGYLFAGAVSRAGPTLPLVPPGNEQGQAGRDGEPEELVGRPLPDSALGAALRRPSQRLPLEGDVERVS